MKTLIEGLRHSLGLRARHERAVWRKKYRDDHAFTRRMQTMMSQVQRSRKKLSAQIVSLR